MKKFKRCLSTVLCGLLTVNALELSAIASNAAVGDFKSYEYDGYEVTYNVTNSWGNTEAITITLSNTSEDDIENWMLYFDPNGDINTYNIWDAQTAISSSGITYFKNAGYNSSIAPNSSVTFRYFVDDCEEIPDEFIMCQSRIEVEDFSVQVVVDDSWNDNFNGTIILTNNSDEPMEDWELSFDTNFTITEITSSWAGTMTMLEPYSYMLKGSYTNVIAPHTSVNLGFSGVKNGNPDIISSTLTAVSVNENMIIWGSLINGNTSLDDLTDSDNDGLPDIIEVKIGTNENIVDTDNDGLPDGYEVLTLNSDPLNPYSFDENISDGIYDIDNDGLSNYQEYQIGTDPNCSDSDYDNLSDSEEISTYFTDPLDEDTDDDGLSDGDEVALGLNPLLADSDNDGEPDNQERFNQNIVFSCPESDEKINHISVSFNGTGFIDSTTELNSIIDSDWMCSNIIGLVGEPYDISTTSDFDEATVTFNVNNSSLGEVSFDNLIVLWYDEDNQIFVNMEATKDVTSHSLTFNTTHFSKYLIVDCTEWYSAWTYNYYPANNVDLHTAITIDCSSSMSSNDPNRYRVDAAKGFVDAMNNNDMASVTLFASHVNNDSLGTLTTDKYLLKQTIDNVTSIGVTNYQEALQYSINSLDIDNNSTSENIIIFLSDGYPTDDNGYSINPADFDYTIVDDAADLGVKIYTIGLTEDVCETILIEMANRTGGEYFYANTAEELIPYFLNINMNEKYDLVTDIDEDNIPDLFETYGMPIANGNILFSSPQSADTDNDTITDGNEVNVIYVNDDDDVQLAAKYVSQYYPGIEVNNYGGIYFKMNSNPNNNDTDGDLDPDNADPNPMKYQLNGFFAKKMDELQKAAQNYLGSSYTILSSDEYYGMKDVWLCFYYIRSLKSSYTENRWKKVAGNDEEFLNYINSNDEYSELKEYFFNLQNIYANGSGSTVEVRHLAAVISSSAYYPTIGELLPDNLSIFELFGALLILDRKEVNYDLDILSSWGGDLQQLMNSAYESTSEGSISNKVYNLLGESDTGFDMDDLYSDIDAEVIYRNIKKLYAGRKSFSSEFISIAINNCYSTSEKERYLFFSDSVELSIENIVYAEKKDLANEYGLNKATYQIFKYPNNITESDYHDIAVQFVNKLNYIFGVT